MMSGFRSRRLLGVACGVGLLIGVTLGDAQQPDAKTLIQRIDAANQARFDNVTEFADTEHYTVLRGDDSKPAAEMTVRVTYRKGVGKSYNILSQSGSAIIRKFALAPLLQNEKEINQPGRVQASWFTSANYDMRPHPDQIKQLSGRS